MGIFTIHDPLTFVLGLLGNVISFVVYLAPLPTFVRVCRKKSTEGFQSVPYVCALFSAMLWLYYGVMSPHCTLIVTINSAGCVIETIYLAIYIAYATKHAKMITTRLLMFFNMGVFGSIVLFTLMLSQGKRRILILGWISSAVSVAVYAAPLGVLRLVICTKSVEFMPFHLSFFLTVSATIWFAYGLSIKDKFVALPNVLGFFLGVLQMAVYMLYRNAREVKDEKPAVGKMSSMGSVEIHTMDVKLDLPVGNSTNLVDINSEDNKKQTELLPV
uniref:Bidirectional sugar transporter SWEET n=1 Tax=Araucaria cunninghamii TaxID=56994 RepID=A0A0D6R436_ARACU